MYDIEIAYSNWILAIIFLIAITFVAVLYYRNTKIKKHIPKTIRYMLFFLRFLSVFVLLFLLLEPSIQKSIDHIKKPTIGFLIDQSKSIQLNNQKDTLFFKIEELKLVFRNLLVVNPQDFLEKCCLCCMALIPTI